MIVGYDQVLPLEGVAPEASQDHLADLDVKIAGWGLSTVKGVCQLGNAAPDRHQGQGRDDPAAETQEVAA